eukprot:UN02811
MCARILFPKWNFRYWDFGMLLQLRGRTYYQCNQRTSVHSIQLLPHKFPRKLFRYHRRFS